MLQIEWKVYYITEWKENRITYECECDTYPCSHYYTGSSSERSVYKITFYTLRKKFSAFFRRYSRTFCPPKYVQFSHFPCRSSLFLLDGVMLDTHTPTMLTLLCGFRAIHWEEASNFLLHLYLYLCCCLILFRSKKILTLA